MSPDKCQNLGINSYRDEAGMASANGDGAEAGNDSGDLLSDPVQITDHSSRNKAGAECKEVPNVDEAKVNDQLKIGEPLGNWLPWNQCQSFASEVLNNASTIKQTRSLTRRGYRYF